MCVNDVDLMSSASIDDFYPEPLPAGDSCDDIHIQTIPFKYISTRHRFHEWLKHHTAKKPEYVLDVNVIYRV